MITSLSDEVGNVRRRGQLKDFEVVYKKLDEFVDNVNQKIVSRLQLYQQVYYEDYKQQMEMMSAELRRLKANLDSDILHHRSSQKMYILEEERDFFRAQVLKLNQEVNILVEQNKNLKQKVSELTEEMTNYKAVTFNLEKKIQKLQLQKSSIDKINRQTSNSTIENVKLPREQTERPKTNNLHKTLNLKGSVSGSRVSAFEDHPKITVRAKTYSKVQSATKASMRRYQEANQRDQIIDECIKQTKKEILLRNSEPKVQIPFQEIGKLTFDKFTRTDKKNVISKLLNNEKLVEEFADFLATRNSADSASRMVRTKIGDEKFNQKFLIDLKRSFNKKMLNLKAAPMQKIRKEYDIQ